MAGISGDQQTASNRPFVILNPNSDHGRTASMFAQVGDWLRELNSEGELIAADNAQHATQTAFDAVKRGYGPIVAVGGDGTVHAVACGVLDAGGKTPLGIVPVGSGNDYAFRALHLPTNPRAALALALNGKNLVVDAARLNNEWMINSFGVGIDANVAWDVRDMVESGHALFRGQQLYTFSALRQVFFQYHHLPTMKVARDGEAHPARRMLLASVMIGPAAGGGYKLTPKADLSDGLLDVLLARRMPRPKVLLALSLLKAGRHTWMREISINTAKTVNIRISRPARAHVDGELIQGASFDIHIVPGALTVKAPQ